MKASQRRQSNQSSGGAGPSERGAGAREPPVWGRRGGTRPSLALPAVAEAAERLLSVSPLRAGLLGHRSGGDASRFAKQFFSQLGIIRQREKVRTGMVANRANRGPRGTIGASWLKMPGGFARTFSPRMSLSLWTQSTQLAEGEKGIHIY